MFHVEHFRQLAGSLRGPGACRLFHAGVPNCSTWNIPNGLFRVFWGVCKWLTCGGLRGALQQKAESFGLLW
jgi:hypothetical protein